MDVTLFAALTSEFISGTLPVLKFSGKTVQEDSQVKCYSGNPTNLAARSLLTKVPKIKKNIVHMMAELVRCIRWHFLLVNQNCCFLEFLNNLFYSKNMMVLLLDFLIIRFLIFFPGWSKHRILRTCPYLVLARCLPSFLITISFMWWTWGRRTSRAAGLFLPTENPNVDPASLLVWLPGSMVWMGEMTPD